MNVRNPKKKLLSSVSVLLLLALLAGCATPTPEMVEKVITQVVKETIIVEGTPQVVEKEVTKVVKETVEVEVEVEKVVTPTSPPKRDVIIVALAQAPTSLDPADHRSRQSETVIRNMFDGLVTRDSTSGVQHAVEDVISKSGLLERF